MNAPVSERIVIRPFSSKRGIYMLLGCIVMGLLFIAMAIFIFIVAPLNDRQGSILKMIMLVMSFVVTIIGITFYFIFPRNKIIFDSSRREVMTRTGRNTVTVIPFNNLQPFQIYHMLRGYAHQYYCCNASFGESSDLFFSSSHGKTLKKAQKLAELTGAALIDDRKIVIQQQPYQ